MTNTRAEAAYRRSIAAFKNPTLDLLHARYAPFVVAVLSTIFTADRAVVAVADAHAEIDELIDELHEAGDAAYERGMPTGNARDMCRYWVKVGWLGYQIENDIEVYRLTAHAVGALEIAGRASGGRTRVTKSRIRTLIDAIGALSDDAETDPAARLAKLQAQRNQIENQIAQLGAGQVTPPDDEQLLEEAENIVHLARELPADFARVAESIKAMQRDVVTDLRQDVRPTGEVLREYLQRGQDVMESTAEGRAFAGALALIGDPEQIDRLTGQLHALLVQPFMAVMDPGQRAELAAIARRIEQGVWDVLETQRQASHVITTQVRTHDPVRDRQIDDLLRTAMSGLQAWMQVSRPGERVEPLRSFPVANIGHLRRALSELAPADVPEPLSDATDVEFVESDGSSWGGPNYPRLEAYVRGLGATFDVAEAFEGADEPDRRPVDLLGLLEIAHHNGMTEQEEVSTVEALRPDGSRRRFAFGAVNARTTKEDDVN